MAPRSPALSAAGSLGHEGGRTQSRAGRCVHLVFVVELDDLSVLVVACRLARETHEQHRADGEVGCHQQVGVGRTGGLRQFGDLRGREAGGADDRVHARPQEQLRIIEDAGRRAELDGYCRFDLRERLADRAEDRSGRRILVAERRVHHADEAHVRLRGDSRCGDRAHAAPGADDQNVDHRGVHWKSSRMVL
jgi:hypothetical protein